MDALERATFLPFFWPVSIIISAIAIAVLCAFILAIIGAIDKWSARRNREADLDRFGLIVMPSDSPHFREQFKIIRRETCPDCGRERFEYEQLGVDARSAGRYAVSPWARPSI